MLKTFTLQEANGLLALVREHHLRISLLLVHLQKWRNKLDVQNNKRLAICQKSSAILLIEKKITNKKHKNIAIEVKKLEQLISEEIQKLMRLGAVVKGLYPPHIDFLSMRNNKPIFLCWHGGEGEIKHWHYLDDGPPTRQHIAENSCFGPLMVH